MPQGDKYISFTNYLRHCHAQGQDKLTLSFAEIEGIWGFPLADSMRRYSWGNARGHSYSLGWLHADYLVTSCDLFNECVTFTFSPEKVKNLLAGNHRPVQQKALPNIPSPSPAEVEVYLHIWNTTEKYRLQESALDKLFFRLSPHNKEIEDILLKASVLNDFYSTNIYSISPVAQHILSLNIDQRLANGDLTLVSDISQVQFPNGTKKTLYSFATKYCSHHRPSVYPIYDDYISRILKYFQNRDVFSSFTNEMLTDYPTFHQILTDFRYFYHLEHYTFKELDCYLWQLGKQWFSKYENRT